MLQKFLSQSFKDANKNVKVEFMDLLFTLNMIEKNRVINDILMFIKEDDKLNVFVL